MNAEQFLEEWRKSNEPAEGPCIVCGNEGDTYCENCRARICSKCADTETYEDVDVCADEDECSKRCDVAELAEQLTGHFLSADCPECAAKIGEPCLLPDNKFHVNRGTGPDVVRN